MRKRPGEILGSLTHAEGRGTRYSRAMLLALVALALAPHVAVTTVEALDDAALVERSDLIARVVVLGARAEYVGRRIITFYDVGIVETWHARSTVEQGTQGTRTVVALPGGVVDGIGQMVPGVPILEVGKQYVLCLGDDTGPSRARGVVGLWQGAFAVVDALRLRPFTHGSVSGDVDMATLRARLMVRR